MSVDARTEKFEHIELFGKPALFTNGRIDRNTVPKGWYCYDFRSSDYDPGKLNRVELHVGVNHSGAVLLPEKLDMKGKDYRQVRGRINFLGESMTMQEFCEAHEISYKIAESPEKVLPVGRVTFVNGEAQEFTNAKDFLKCIQEELTNHPTTGFRYEVLTDDPTIRKTADDILYNLYGKENPHTLKDYETKPEPGVTMGGLS